MSDFTARLKGCTVFSKVDLAKAYHQIPMHPEHIPKTAIVTPFGTFEFLRMPFGLKNSAQAFQRLMDSIFGSLSFVFVYLDDLLIASRSPAKHKTHLCEVFELLRQNGLFINKSKCILGVPSLSFLVHKVNKDEISPMPERVEAISAFPQPKTKKQLQSFLGMVNFYHRFIPHIADVLVPLHACIVACGNAKLIPDELWSPECTASFSRAKLALSSAVLLRHPSAKAETHVTVDASQTALGGCLEKREGDFWFPVAFYSKKLLPAEKKYSTFDRELLAVFRAISHFRCYVEGWQFHVLTDHKPLCHVLTSLTGRSPRQTRHLSFVAEFRH